MEVTRPQPDQLSDPGAEVVREPDQFGHGTPNEPAAATPPHLHQHTVGGLNDRLEALLCADRLLRIRVLLYLSKVQQRWAFTDHDTRIAFGHDEPKDHLQHGAR
jgi:hypothetical protein